MTSNTSHSLVRPGEGLQVEKIHLTPVLDELRSGTYELDGAQQSVRDALDDPETTKGVAKAILNDPPNKSFKIAFTSLIMEQIWPAYSTLATDEEEAGIYKLRFEGDKAKLARQSAESMANSPLSVLADQIAVSNQAMMTFYAYELFSSGKVPEICGEAEKDTLYFNAFREQTELQLTRTNHYFRTIPQHLDSPSRFVTSGLQSIRTHVFGIPNLLDGVSANEGIALTPDQHRTGVGITYNKSITPYFYPTGPLMMAIDSEFADPETQRLLPDRWVSNGDPGKFFVFPRPQIVRNANETAAQRNDLPAQTGCPVVHSRVPNHEAPGAAMPFTRALGRVVFWQLDRLYYPQWHKALAKRMIDVGL